MTIHPPHRRPRVDYKGGPTAPLKLGSIEQSCLTFWSQPENDTSKRNFTAFPWIPEKLFFTYRWSSVPFLLLAKRAMATTDHSENGKPSQPSGYGAVSLELTGHLYPHRSSKILSAWTMSVLALLGASKWPNQDHSAIEWEAFPSYLNGLSSGSNLGE